MYIKFSDRKLSDLARKDFKGKSEFPFEVIKGFRKRIAQMRAARSTYDLSKISGLNFEKLKSKEYRDRYSIRVNKAYRLIFLVENDVVTGLEIINVEDLNNHYS